MSPPPFKLTPGHTPLLVSLPHAGTHIPPDLAPRFTERALSVPDTDWHLEPLYAFARELGASVLVPLCSRYVIDLNRPPENTPMYSGANNTELCPTRAFTGQPLYREGCGPTDSDIQSRLEQHWRPYHQALAVELKRLKAQHGHAVLFDGHSIKSRLPWLFEGQLPDLNLGTVNGQSCALSMREALAAVLGAQSRFSHVVDGRFKGGHITRHYGRPHEGVHAVQLEMCWRCYLDEPLDDGPPGPWVPERAAAVLPVLRQLLLALLHWKP
jgi:N-formylglutamate deformylase